MKITDSTQRKQPLWRTPEARDEEPRDVFEPRPWPREAEPVKAAPKPKPPPEATGPLTDLLGKAEAANQDLQSAREIAARMLALRRLTDAKILAILADAQTQIFSLWQEVMARRRKACDEALARWNKLLFE